MTSNVVAIPTGRITDWDSFHAVLAESLGFPAWYGRNMNALIDCLSFADEPAGMVANPVPAGQLLTLRLDGVAGFQARCPEQFQALLDAIAFVNLHRAEAGQEPVVALLMG